MVPLAIEHSGRCSHLRCPNCPLESIKIRDQNTPYSRICTSHYNNSNKNSKTIDTGPYLASEEVAVSKHTALKPWKVSDKKTTPYTAQDSQPREDIVTGCSSASSKQNRSGFEAVSTSTAAGLMLQVEIVSSPLTLDRDSQIKEEIHREEFSDAEEPSTSATEPESNGHESDFDSSDSETVDDTDVALKRLDSLAAAVLNASGFGLGAIAYLLLQINLRLKDGLHDPTDRHEYVSDNNLAYGKVEVSASQSWTFGDAYTCVQAPVGGTQNAGAAGQSGNGTQSTSTTRQPKRRRNNESSEKDEESDDVSHPKKRPRTRFSEEPPPKHTFACLFHKKTPNKYNPFNNQKFLKCPGPGPVELRRLNF
ncbi:hypothetical protein BP5796_00870 [Coleophoma crateriformis]|uniref:Uncharacterized protein n=1 Tax=Coleophoma crateriformis TaxID=565419 RepID=A0A3D8T9A7_9HELO|nr:hypothetical protein BP5796_00870 [Coleophoma crateriformis]